MTLLGADCPLVLWTDISFEECFAYLWSLGVLILNRDNGNVGLHLEVSRFQRKSFSLQKYR